LNRIERTLLACGRKKRKIYKVISRPAHLRLRGAFILLAAWWPRANGTIISMRIGLYSTGKTPLCRDEAARRLREWLGVRGAGE